MSQIYARSSLTIHLLFQDRAFPDARACRQEKNIALWQLTNTWWLFIIYFEAMYDCRTNEEIVFLRLDDVRSNLGSIRLRRE